MVYGPISPAYQHDFTATGVFSALTPTCQGEYLAAGRLIQNDFEAACNVTFDPPVEIGHGRLCSGAFIERSVLRDFINANNGLYPAIGEKVDVSVRVDTWFGNVAVSMRPAIGGTQSIAA